MWSLIFSVSSALIASLSLAVAVWSARTAIRVLVSQQAPQRFNESQLQSLRDSIAENADALSTLANKVKMMKVRAASNHSEGSPGEPDPYKEPDKWREQMQRKLGRAGHN